jgi:hypothetical protein
MDGQTKIVWDFLNAAYRTGALDNFMVLSKAATDKKYDNQATVFAELEDAISEMEDFSSVDLTLEKAFRQMSALSDEATLLGLGALASIMTPLVESAMESVDRDTERLKEKRDKLLSDLPKIAKATFKLMVLNSGSIASAVWRKIRKK